MSFTDGQLRLWDLSAGSFDPTRTFIGTLAQCINVLARSPGPAAVERLDSLDSAIEFNDLGPARFHVWTVRGGQWAYVGAHTLEDFQFYVRFGIFHGATSGAPAKDPGPFFTMRAS